MGELAHHDPFKSLLSHFLQFLHFLRSLDAFWHVHSVGNVYSKTYHRFCIETVYNEEIGKYIYIRYIGIHHLYNVFGGLIIILPRKMVMIKKVFLLINEVSPSVVSQISTYWKGHVTISTGERFLKCVCFLMCFEISRFCELFAAERHLTLEFLHVENAVLLLYVHVHSRFSCESAGTSRTWEFSVW